MNADWKPGSHRSFAIYSCSKFVTEFEKNSCGGARYIRRWKQYITCWLAWTLGHKYLKLKLRSRQRASATSHFKLSMSNNKQTIIIIIIIMFFELFLLRKISEFPSGTRTHSLQQLGNSDIFLSKNSSNNIIIVTSELAYIF